MAGIIMYTDGASSGNPGPGGFGVVLISGQHRREISKGYRLTTNNRMELLSVIEGLEALKYSNQDVKIYSDSTYVVESVEKRWVFDWAAKGFKKKKNPDLWSRFLKIYAKHNVKLIWVRGHAGNPENERCDQLAVQASQGDKLLVDEGYERSIKEC